MTEKKARRFTPRIEYSEQDIDNFIETAEELGITRAIRELGYPSWPTAQKWCKKRNVTPPKSITQALATLNNQTYSLEDKLSVANDLIDRYKEMLTTKDLDAMELKRITEGYKLAMETYNLILGKATQITQKADAMDNDYVDLLEQMKQTNAELEQTE